MPSCLPQQRAKLLQNFIQRCGWHLANKFRLACFPVKAFHLVGKNYAADLHPFGDENLKRVMFDWAGATSGLITIMPSTGETSTVDSFSS